MLTAHGRPAPPPTPRPWPRSRRDTAAIAVSLLLHGVALATLLIRPGGRLLPPPEQPLEVEMVQQQQQDRGAPPPPASPSPVPDAKATPSPSAPAPSPPLPETRSSPSPPAAAPSSPPPPSLPRPQARQTPPTVNLGNAADDLDPLSVTGENIVPAAPDSRYRNESPRYPARAAKLGAEGTVQLVVRVAPDGRALGAEVLTSSGNADLDAEARRAVELWRFRPARAGTAAVPYDYVINIRFALGNR